MKLLKCLLALGAVILMSCSQPSQTPAAADQTPPAPDTAAIRQAGQERFAAVSAGNPDGYFAAYSDDAVWMPPGTEEIIGKAAARQRLEGALDKIEFEMETTTDEEVVLSQDWVLDRGSYTMTRTAKEDGQIEDAVGSYLTLWRRGPDGSWKIVYDIWNSDRPLAGDE